MDWHKAWQSCGPSDKLASIRSIKEESDCREGWEGPWTGHDSDPGKMWDGRDESVDNIGAFS